MRRARCETDNRRRVEEREERLGPQGKLACIRGADAAAAAATFASAVASAVGVGVASASIKAALPIRVVSPAEGEAARRGSE